MIKSWCISSLNLSIICEKSQQVANLIRIFVFLLSFSASSVFISKSKQRQSFQLIMPEWMRLHFKQWLKTSKSIHCDDLSDVVFLFHRVYFIPIETSTYIYICNQTVNIWILKDWFILLWTASHSQHQEHVYR